MDDKGIIRYNMDMAELKMLPDGKQTFEKLIKDGFIYVDKTDLMYKFTKEKQFVFLSRPRRFGKSLLISTLKAYFEGKKELFNGLKIESLEKEWKKYPVIHFDFSHNEYSSKKDLIIALDKQLRNYEEIYSRDEKDVNVSSRFETLIRNAYNQTGEQVVILVDEYDTPLLESPTKYLDGYRKTYSAFFKNLKSLDAYIRFAFITGVTKFSKVSIFSTLNNLSELTLKDDYATLCGITEEELIDNFKPYIERLASKYKLTTDECLARLKNMYDGYHFSDNGPGVYNPYSLLSCFSDCKFGYYWFETGTPTFLVRKIMDNNYDMSTFSKGVFIDSESILSYEEDCSNIISTLYQAGYLTIIDYNDNRERYTLAFPNTEVERAFVKLARLTLFGKTKDARDNMFNIADAIEVCDIDMLISSLKALYAGVPYTTKEMTEEVFRNYFYLVFKVLGRDVRCEEYTAKGRTDITLYTNDYIYLIEIKKNQTAQEAMKQIEENKYADKFALDGRKVIKLGINFSTKDRNINSHEVKGI